MKRIAIIGPPGAGKSTLARDLYGIHNIKIYHLDRILWERGWKWKPRDTKIDILQKLVPEKQWIIEGFYLKISEPRLEAADTIIFLDMPPFLCLLRLWKRRHTPQKSPRRDIPMDSTDKFDLKLLLKVLCFPFRDRILLQRNLARYEGTKRVIHLCTPEEVAAFLAEQATERTTHDHVPMHSARPVKKPQTAPVLSSQ